MKPKDKSNIFTKKDAEKLKPFADTERKKEDNDIPTFDFEVIPTNLRKIEDEKTILKNIKGDYKAAHYLQDVNIDPNTGLIKRKAGRPKGTTELSRIKNVAASLTAFDRLLLKGLKAALKDKSTHSWSLKLFMSYRFGNPATSVDIHNHIEELNSTPEITIPIIKFIDNSNKD